MKKQTGSALWIVLGLVFVFMVSMVGTYINKANEGTRHETNIEKFDKDSQNVLSAYTMKIKEMAQIPDKFKADLQDVIKQTFEGRYGADGSKAVFQFIKEQNMTLDPSLYRNIQVAMEAGRNDFKMSQTKKLDACAGYENARNYVVGGFFLQMAGFPKKDIDKLCRIIVDSSTTDKFNSGVDEVIKL